MLEQRKALYMNSEVIVEMKTLLGSKVATLPYNYLPYIIQKYPTKDIFRIDALKCLEAWFGPQFLTAREVVYKLVSGDLRIEDKELFKKEYGSIISSYYRKYEKFSNYVNNKRLDKQYTIPELIKPLRLDIELTKDRLRKSCSAKCKYLFEDRDYMYFAFEKEMGEPDLGLEGSTSCIWLEHYLAQMGQTVLYTK